MKAYLNNINWIKVIGMLLGAATLQVFLLQVYSGHFTVSGMGAYLGQIVTTNKAPAYWNLLLTFFAHQPLFSVVLLGLVMLACVVGLFFSSSPIYPLLSSALYASFWLSNLGSPGSWLFELLFPALFSLIVALAQWEIRQYSTSKSSWLGHKVLPSKNNIVSGVIAVILLLMFSYFNYLSKNGGENVIAVTALFSVLTALITYCSLSLDIRCSEIDHSLLQRVNRKYLFLIASTIGLMLIYQVNADISLNWFTSEGYKHLVDTYQKTSNAPEFVKSFLALSASISSTLAPTQFVFESLAALCLFVGIFRAPMYWLTTGLLGLLMVIEFGIPATWQPTPTSPVNWVWELMLPTLVLAICSVHATVEVFESKSIRQLIFGNQLFTEVSIATKALIAGSI